MKDPVCGMDVKPDQAAAKTEHQGQTYYFCSPNCKKEFEKKPDSYQSGASKKTPERQRM